MKEQAARMGSAPRLVKPRATSPAGRTPHIYRYGCRRCAFVATGHRDGEAINGLAAHLVYEAQKGQQS